MGINASKVKTERKFTAQPQIEEGQYPARLVQVIDMGLQPQKPYKGEAKAPAHEVNFTFELVDVFMVDEEGNDIEDKPRWLSKVVKLKPLAADLAISTKLAKALDPKDELKGDFGAMLGFPLNLGIGVEEKQGKVYTNIIGFAAMRARDAEKCPELKNPTKVFDLDNPDLETFESLPEWLREKIKGNLEFAQSPLDKALGGEKQPPVREQQGPQNREVENGNENLEVSEDDMPW